MKRIERERERRKRGGDDTKIRFIQLAGEERGDRHRWSTDSVYIILTRLLTVAASRGLAGMKQTKADRCTWDEWPRICVVGWKHFQLYVYLHFSLVSSLRASLCSFSRIRFSLSSFISSSLFIYVHLARDSLLFSLLHPSSHSRYACNPTGFTKKNSLRSFSSLLLFFFPCHSFLFLFRILLPSLLSSLFISFHSHNERHYGWFWNICSNDLQQRSNTIVKRFRAD